MNYRLSPAIFEICPLRCLVYTLNFRSILCKLLPKLFSLLKDVHICMNISRYEWILFLNILLAPSLLSFKLKMAACRIKSWNCLIGANLSRIYIIYPFKTRFIRDTPTCTIFSFSNQIITALTIIWSFGVGAGGVNVTFIGWFLWTFIYIYNVDYTSVCGTEVHCISSPV